MTINYNRIKQTVPPVEAAKRYGSVKHGFMCCPFHADRTPSLKLYGDHFHCFGCCARGDVIYLAAGLLGCSKSEAARRLEALRREAYAPDLPIKSDRIQVANGTMFLNGKFSGEREFYRNRLQVAYNENAKLPETWLRFLDEPLYPEDIPTLQEFMGHCFLPMTKGQKELMLIGRGA